MNIITRRFFLLSSMLFSMFLSFNASADQLQCAKEDVTGQWTVYSIDFGVADHVEYQEIIDVVFLQTLDGVDQFLVSFSGAFSTVDNHWVGKCIGDQYVLNGEINSHGNVHSIQAARNSSAPTTDQCSLERCESTCIGDLIAECSASKSIVDEKLTFMLLPGHAEEVDDGTVQYVGGELGCDAHDCNHAGAYHTHP